MILQFFIPGTPKPKQSARFRIAGKGEKQFISSYQTQEIKNEEKAIKWIIKEQLPNGFIPHTGPVVINYVIFRFPPLKNMKKADRLKLEEGRSIWKTTKPDLSDNLMKGLCDAMEGIVYRNDSQICRIGSSKVYHQTPGIEVQIELL